MHQLDHQSGQHVEVAGARIYVETHGPRDAPCLVLLHGGLGTIEDFKGITPFLQDYRLVAIDTRGHGKSTLGRETWSYERVQLDIEQVLAHLHVRRCIVVGFSDGGIAGLRLAAARKVHVDKLVTIGATWHARTRAGVRDILAKVTPESWRAKFPDGVALYERLNPEPDFERLVPTVVSGWLDDSASGHPDERVRDIECPVLVVRGDEDHLVPLPDTVELCAALRQAHFLSIPFAGHVAHDDGREIFALALQRFLHAGSFP